MRKPCSTTLSKSMIYTYREKLHDRMMRAWSHFPKKQYSDFCGSEGCKSYRWPPRLYHLQKTLTCKTHHRILFTQSSDRQGVYTWCCICER